MISFFWVIAIFCACVGCWTIGLAVGRGVHWLAAVIGLYRNGILQARREDD